MSSRLCPRSRRRATIRAWATAGRVHSPPPSTPGITPLFAQRRRVSGLTPACSAASFVVTVSAISTGKLPTGPPPVGSRPPHTREESVNYFVTGATGFIGRHLVERLLEREGTVYALVREGSRDRL